MLQSHQPRCTTSVTFCHRRTEHCCARLLHACGTMWQTIASVQNAGFWLNTANIWEAGYQRFYLRIKLLKNLPFNLYSSICTPLLIILIFLQGNNQHSSTSITACMGRQDKKKEGDFQITLYLKRSQLSFSGNEVIMKWQILLEPSWRIF